MPRRPTSRPAPAIPPAAPSPPPGGWLAAEDWARVQASVPVCCADVLPLRASRHGAKIIPPLENRTSIDGRAGPSPARSASGTNPLSPPTHGDAPPIERVGLIWRETPHQGRRWCLVGGRLWRDESFAEAVARQLRQTLGDRLSLSIPATLQPTHVHSYFTTPARVLAAGVGSVDPRQHAVALTFCVAVGGEPAARGEALKFKWFDPAALPPVEKFGFEQDRVVRACLDRLGVPYRFGGEATREPAHDPTDPARGGTPAGPPGVRKIVSGGQTGADQGGLRAAKILGLATGGWMPRGFLTLAGPAPHLAAEFGLRECPTADYPARTEANARDSDATLRFARRWDSPGERCTLKFILRHAKPYFDVDLDSPPPVEEARRWLVAHRVRVLNVAGNASRNARAAREIETFVIDYLTRLLRPAEPAQAS